MKLIRKILFTVAFLTAAGVMVYSGFQIATVLRDRHASSSANEALQQQAVVAVKPEEPKISKEELTATIMTSRGILESFCPN